MSRVTSLLSMVPAQRRMSRRQDFTRQTLGRAARSVIETLEGRRLLSVSGLNITSITSTADTDGLTNEHVSIPAGTVANVVVNLSYGSANGPVTAKAVISNADHSASNGTFIAVTNPGSVAVSISALPPGHYNVQLLAKDSASGANVQDNDTDAVLIGDNVFIDVTAPTISHTITGTLGNNGWYTSDVSVDWAATDGESAADPTNRTDMITADTAGTQLSFSSTSTGGVSSDSLTIKRDATKPTTNDTLSATAGTNDWYTSSVSVQLSGNDATSGVDTTYYTVDAGAPQTYAGDFTVNGDGSHTVSFYSVDNAGNVEAAHSDTFKIDATAPTLSTSINDPAGTGWYNQTSGPAVVTYVASDDTSGVSTPLAYTFPDGTGLSLAAITVTDAAGNTSEAAGAFSGIDQDTVAPVLSASINSAAGTGWYNVSTGAAEVIYSVVESGSGATTPTAYTFADGADQSRAAITVTDFAGNVSNAAGAQSGINQDTVAPTLSGLNNITRGPNAVGGAYVSFTDPTANDSGSGVQSLAFDPLSGSLFAVGTKTVNATATDVAGNSTPGNFTVTVNPAGVDSSGNLWVLPPAAKCGINVQVNASNPAAITVTIGGVAQGSFAVTGGGHIVVYGTSCADSVNVSGGVNAELHGLAGNDILTGGAGHDVIWGDEGDDQITGSAGNDVLVGGGGADRVVGSSGNDVLISGRLANDGTGGMQWGSADYATLRALGNTWASSHATNADLTDNSNDGGAADIIDTSSGEMMTGSSGSDWFVVGSDDKITDLAKDIAKDGDIITTV